MVLVALLLCASPVEDAQKHLEAGQLDEVLFDLDGKKLTAAEAKTAAVLLAKAGAAALEKKDETFALQFAQMSLKHQPKDNAHALEVGARAAFKLEQFETAERLADQWVALDGKNAAARLLRAELAMAAGEWKPALEHLAAAKFEGPLAARAAELKAKASKELDDRKGALTQVSAMEKQLIEAAALARQQREKPDAFAPALSSKVIVYSTAWCGYCKKAKAWLSKKKVEFEEKDVEKDPAAAKELAQKAVAQGVAPGGVPVIDVRGKLIVGFDEKALEQAL
jgi:glutaredoxin